MLNRNFLVLAMLVVFGLFLVAFSGAKSEKQEVYEYVTLTQESDYAIFISEQGKELRKVKIDLKPRSEYDFRMLYNELNKYEAAGWNLFSNNFSNKGTAGITQNSFLLRRKKQ